MAHGVDYHVWKLRARVPLRATNAHTGAYKCPLPAKSALPYHVIPWVNTLYLNTTYPVSTYCVQYIQCIDILSLCHETQY